MTVSLYREIIYSVRGYMVSFPPPSLLSTLSDVCITFTCVSTKKGNETVAALSADALQLKRSSRRCSFSGEQLQQYRCDIPAKTANVVNDSQGHISAQWRPCG